MQLALAQCKTPWMLIERHMDCTPMRASFGSLAGHVAPLARYWWTQCRSTEQRPLLHATQQAPQERGPDRREGVPRPSIGQTGFLQGPCQKIQAGGADTGGAHR